MLAPVYGRFTEGFECPDLKEARRLLKEMSNPEFLYRDEVGAQVRTSSSVRFGDEAPNLAQLVKPC